MHQGEKVRKLREDRGWTQEELRDRLERIGRKMTRSNISFMEKREWLEGELIADLSRVFGVSPAEFFEPDQTLPAETREEMIDRAFEYVRRDPTVRMGSAAMGKFPHEAKLALIRMYEKYTGRKLLPDEIV